MHRRIALVMMLTGAVLAPGSSKAQETTPPGEESAPPSDGDDLDGSEIPEPPGAPQATPSPPNALPPSAGQPEGGATAGDPAVLPTLPPPPASDRDAAPGTVPPPPPAYGDTWSADDHGPGGVDAVEVPPPVTYPSAGGSTATACHDDRDLPDRAARPVGAKPSEACVRSWLEIAELYLVGGFFGLYAGVYFGDRLELSEGPLLAGAMVTVTGSLLGVWALDGGGTGSLPEGLPSTITTGFAVGLLGGLLTAGASGRDDDVWRYGFVGTALGGAVGTLAAFGLVPTRRDVSLVRSGGIWGTFFGGMIGFARTEDSDGDPPFTGALVGLGVGTLGGALLTSIVPWSRRRILYLDLGAVVGAFGGSLVLATISERGGLGNAVLGWGYSLFTLAGMGLSLLVSAGADGIDPEDATDYGNAEATLRPHVAPLPEGGLVAGASLQF